MNIEVILTNAFRKMYHKLLGRSHSTGRGISKSQTMNGYCNIILVVKFNIMVC